MEQSSQTAPARRQRRPWTEEDQRQAMRLQAEGMGYRAIGRAMGRNNVVVRARLDAAAAQSHAAKMAAWRNENPHARKQYGKAYYWENRSKRLEKSRSWHKNNIRYQHERTRQWRIRNPDKNREATRRYAARKRAAYKSALNPLSKEQQKHRFDLFSSHCAYCGGTGALAVEHVLPLSKGGLDEANNVVPACPRCNSSKRDHFVEDWYRRQPFFTEERWRKIQRHCPAAVAGQLPLALS